MTETISGSPPTCHVPNRVTPQNCEKTKNSSTKVTLRGTRVYGLTSFPKNILGSKCSPEIVGFQTNTNPMDVPYGKLKGLAKGGSTTVKFSQSETGPFGGFGTQTYKLVLKVKLTRVN